MLENDTKGWHGNYSTVGRTSAERYQTIKQLEDILKGNKKKPKIFDYFKSKEEINFRENEEDKDKTDIFLRIRKEFEKKLESQKKKKKIFDSDKYKYHKDNVKHFERKRIKFQKTGEQEYCLKPDCTRYTPKMDFVWKKTTSTIAWDAMKHTVIPKKPKSKQICSRKLKKINKTESNKNDSNLFNNSVNESYKYDGMSHNMSTTTFNQNNKNLNETPCFNVYKKKSLFKNNLCLNKNASHDTIRNTKKRLHYYNKNNWKNIKAPDFSKTIDRATLDRIQRDRGIVYPFICPSYEAVKPRILNTVTYSTKKNKKRINKYDILTQNNIYNIDKAIININNYTRPKAIEFSKMYSRPETDINLPMYMIKRTDRNGMNMISDKTLKMNKYEDSIIRTDYSSFYPKKSFNRQLNLKLLSNNKFIEDNMQIYEDNNNKLNDYYAKNLDDINAEDVADEIDGITYRTLKKKSVISDKEKKLFTFDYNNDDIN